jgi:hypothetical protein
MSILLSWRTVSDFVSSFKIFHSNHSKDIAIFHKHAIRFKWVTSQHIILEDINTPCIWTPFSSNRISKSSSEANLPKVTVFFFSEMKIEFAILEKISSYTIETHFDMSFSGVNFLKKLRTD